MAPVGGTVGAPMSFAAPQPLSLVNLPDPVFAGLAHDVTTRLAASATLENAAQGMASVLYDRFPASIALVRQYIAMPFYRLPARERGLVVASTTRRVQDETPVLTLMGTRGAMLDWNDRRRSRAHTGIALLDRATVDAQPLVSGLLSALGVQTAWFDEPRETYVRKLSASGANGVFHVDDARETRDAEGRPVISSQAFVEAHEIRSVFGVGGAYLNGWIAATVIFSRERLSAADVNRFAPLAGTFKLATMWLVASGKIFAAEG